jgi:hypothetical protein
MDFVLQLLKTGPNNMVLCTKNQERVHRRQLQVSRFDVRRNVISEPSGRGPVRKQSEVFNQQNTPIKHFSFDPLWNTVPEETYTSSSSETHSLSL